jgi:HEAT repeat protein
LSTYLHRMSALLAAAVALTVVAGVACARESDAQAAPSSAAIVADDTASLARLLNAVRGVDPLLCELATRSVDMHGWWSRWGSLGGNPLDVDSASAALIAWIQREHNDPTFVPRLRSAMRDTDACVRRVAGSFLGRIEHPSAVEALLTALDDARAETRQVAALGLGLADKPAAALQPLIRRLRDESAAVRRAAAWALGSLEEAAALNPLIEVLERDADAGVRQAAAWAIGRIHG